MTKLKVSLGVSWYCFGIFHGIVLVSHGVALVFLGVMRIIMCIIVHIKVCIVKNLPW